MNTFFYFYRHLILTSLKFKCIKTHSKIKATRMKKIHSEKLFYNCFHRLQICLVNHETNSALTHKM